MLLITSDDKDDVLEYELALSSALFLSYPSAPTYKSSNNSYFRTQKVVDYARGGFVPVETIERHPGPIQLSHSIEPHLRALGMRG